jgi:hypothetical protein
MDGMEEPMGRLISKKYRDLNAELHQQSQKFGSGGHRWASRVIAFIEEGYSVLDYGCGKGTLRNAVNYPIAEYDPAIDGKDQEPSVADLVVCTDVLEHIEPHNLESVLAHLLSLTNRRLIFNIATKPARTHLLPDGRNPHLIVKPAWWWRLQLEKHFSILSWQITANYVNGEALPIKEMPAIQSIPAWDESARFENIRNNCARTDKRLQDGVEPHGRTAVLVCYGPSLKETWRVAASTDGDLFTVSGAHGFMIDHGAVPYAQIDCDPRPHKAAQFGTPNKSVRYWLGSCVHPDYLDRLEGHDISLWHLHNGADAADNVWSIEPEAWLCVGGGSVGLRSISLLYALGYRHFEIHGMDCSNADGKMYAGAHLGKHRESRAIRCGNRWFDSTLSMIDYARQFLDDLRLWPDATFRVHGDGLLAYMIKQTGETKHE